MGTEERIKRAKTSLIIMQPFFGVYASMLHYEEKPDNWWSPNYPTMATDGKSIFYAASFVDQITDNQLVAVLLHEIYHGIYMHCGRVRMAGRDYGYWGLAIDYVVNAEIVEDVKIYELPEDCLYDHKFYGMTSEEAYDEVVKNKKKYDKMLPQIIYIDMPGGTPNGKCPGCGRGIHIPLEALPEDIKEKILTAYEASGRGNVPAGIERLVKQIRQAKVHWERLLHRYVGNAITKNDYTFNRPNRRFIAEDIYLPSLYKPVIGDIVFACDTSGSMGEKDLTQILSEMAKLSHLVTKITVMSCDADVHEVVQTYSIKEIISKVKFKGGGGTNFCPVFDKIKEMTIKPELLIFATDTDGIFPDKKPPYNVLWVSTKSKEDSQKIPFGQAIYME